jgi:16S rRNA (cytosine967-C5)-methyltransferase
MNNPRIIALDLVDKVLSRRFNFDDAFEREERINSLEQRDKNFIRNLCLTAFRHLGEIDHFLTKFTRSHSNILRLAVTQLQYLKLPPYAVVSEMVELAETKEHKGFINAILRKAPEYKFEENIALNFPKWMIGNWKKSYGADVVKCFLQFLMQQPALDLTVKNGFRIQDLGSGEEINPHIPTPESLPNGTIRLKEWGNVQELHGYEAGNWWVQDASATFAAKMLGDIKGKQVLDLCAAPGGKTAQLCDAGAIVTAVDDSERRIERLKQNMQRLGFEPKIICADARQVTGQFDAILLDAPCTATGTIARNPDVLHSRTEDDVKEMAQLQKSMIEHCHGLLKPGGVLVYATCSLQYEEGEGQIKKLSQNWKLEEEKRILPNMYAEFGGNGGFYCAKLLRI